MFYSQFILAKKGPLGTIWIAAHLERKLRKNQVADIDIGVSVDSILSPEMPIALRLSSHLLLGVVRIYSRKVNYLFDDCSEALLKVKQAFRSAAVDLPPEESKAPYHSITLPETFDLDDFELPDNEIFQGNYVDHHVSSREQITLQDTMDGVVYSTSQFGLDERFGDGDTSHIALELDEELLLDKDAAQENNTVQEYCPQGSDETTIINKEDTNDSAAMQVDDSENELEDQPTKSESFEYAQAPATPGLVEVPNLSSIQEGLACDDHNEPEDEYLTQAVAAESRETIPKEFALQTTDKNLVNQSFDNDLNNGSTVATFPENGCLSGDMDQELRTSQENTESNAMHVADGAFSGLDGANNMESNGGVKSVDRTDGECVESPSCSNVTYDTEYAGRRITSNNQLLPVSKESGQDTGNPADHAEATKNTNTCLSESPCSPTIVDYEAQACLVPKDSVQEVSSARIHVLQPCTSHHGQHDLPSLEGEGCINKESDLGLTHGDVGNSCEPPTNVISCDDQLENSNHDGTSDLPAPEKLLSVTEGLDRPTDLLIESTPDREVLGGADGSAFGARPFSGRKRNYTESRLTVESINSVESFGQTRPKRVVDSVPDDDDLLSSILVGRKSSAMKLKPTPAFEVASAKRVRYAPRPNMSKRKVLMDDSMVLHGDTIRQQLTDTEDIRRVRKKAPCSHPEISMIQRQFMEDEIFRQPVHDMSAELQSLHNGKYELSGISISEVDENHASTEVANGAECSIMPEGTIHSDQNEVQSVGTPRTESHQQNIDMQQNIHAVADVSESLLREPLNETAEIDVDKRTAEVADAANESVIDGFEVPSYLDPDERLRTQPGEEDASIDETRNSRGTDGIHNVVPEIDNNLGSEFEKNAGDVSLAEDSKLGTSVEINPDFQADCSVPDENDSLETLNVETGEFLNGAKATDEAGTIKVGELNEDLGKDAYLELEDKYTTNMCDEEPKMDSNGGEKPAIDEVDTIDAEITAQESENIAIANDTEFLNVDDEFGEEDDEGMQYGEETGILDNSGWSSRTRAVAKYLQNLFDNETVQGKKVLPVDGLLAGKTRKEAARMFFETLVLKTKDYIQVEQPRPFDNINVKPRAKLLKSDF